MNKTSKPLLGSKVAILVANGFNQQELMLAQRALLDAGANARIVSPESGLVHSWNDDSWGHNYAIDAPLSEALGADYAMLVVPGGARAMDKLKLTAHTKRFLGSFIAMQKPIALCGDALMLLALTENLAGREVAGPPSMEATVLHGGATWAGEQVWAQDGNLLTGACLDEAGRKEFVMKMVDSFTAYATMPSAA